MVKQKFLLLTLFVVFSASMSAFGQNSNVERNAGEMIANGKGFFMDAVQISYAEALNYAKPYPEVTKHLKAGRGMMVGTYIVSFGGGFMLGWGLGTQFNRKAPKSSKKTGRYLMAGGAVLIAGAFGLEVGSIGQYKKAARAYNAATGYADVTPDCGMTLSLACTQGGLGLQLTF